MAQKTLGDVEQRKKYNEQFKRELFPIKIDPRAKRTTVKCPSAPNEAAEDCYSSAKPQSEVKYSFNTPSNGQHMISHIYGGVLLTQ